MKTWRYFIDIIFNDGLSDRKIKQIFVEMDTDRTGKVDIEHFIAWMDKDIDKSGFRKVLSSSMGIGGLNG